MNSSHRRQIALHCGVENFRGHQCNSSTQFATLGHGFKTLRPGVFAVQFPRVRKLIKRTALGVFLLLLLLVAAALLFPGPFLTVDSGPVKADVVVLLGGGSHERPERAAELFKEHVAPRIIISGYGDCEINRHLLVAAGVPAKAIEVESKSKTTKENAQFTIQLLREQKLKRVILVTSWYHSRRALACFRHEAPDIKFFSRPSYFASARAEWSHNRIGNRVRLEYVKLLGYWLRYGVCPF
jgi:uncharacterized SAM-binding protein YcdF (DUF218 family)